MERPHVRRRAACPEHRTALSGWWVRRLDEIPAIAPDEPDDPEWFPLQHHFGLSTVGINVYRATEAGDVLIGDHDETGSGHEELYYVTAGRALFTLGGEKHEAAAGTVVVVREPGVRRMGVALERGTTVVAVGGKPNAEFASSWQPQHFEGVPQVH